METAKIRKELGDFYSDLEIEIAELRTELKTEIANLRAELKTEIANLRAELKTEIADLRAETKTDFLELQKSIVDIHKTISVQTRWILAGMLGVATLSAAIGKIIN
ncbi:hypothetical protein LEP1GSC018_2000 [Leptospira kirschneri str. 2008720114]|nr:hypothetical protein LEP1GSC018_2000 [Leptospira kirschneri str. 2008720114]